MGDAMNADDVRRAMEGQDILLGSLEGDVLTMAKNIVAALLNMFAKQRPDYIVAAETIAASPAVTTLLRCPGIKDGDKTDYCLTREGEQPTCWGIDRAGIAQCMANLIEDETLGVNESRGILQRCERSRMQRGNRLRRPQKGCGLQRLLPQWRHVCAEGRHGGNPR